MEEKKKIKDTSLGLWLKDKAPGVLSTVGDLLPDRGALGLVKNLLNKDPKIDPDEAKAMVDAEIAYQNNVTERWKADMSSDVKLAKLIRPVMLIVLIIVFVTTMFLDSLDNQPFNVKDSYVSLLEILMLTVFGAYFAGRTVKNQEVMPENLSHFEFLAVAGALVGGWIKFQADYNKLSARVAVLEADNSEFKEDIKQLLREVQEVKLLLAKNQVQ